MLKKKKLIILLIVITLISVFLLVTWFSKSSFERAVILGKSNYSENWKYDYIITDDEKKLVDVCFEIKPLTGGWEGKTEDIRRVYTWICEKAHNAGITEEYSLRVCFCMRAVGRIFYVTDAVYNLEIGGNIPVKTEELWRVFPDADAVNLCILFDDISEIKEFENLSYLYTNYTLSSEDMAVIESYHPDCIIEFPGKEILYGR